MPKPPCQVSGRPHMGALAKEKIRRLRRHHDQRAQPGQHHFNCSTLQSCRSRIVHLLLCGRKGAETKASFNLSLRIVAQLARRPGDERRSHAQDQRDVVCRKPGAITNRFKDCDKIIVRKSFIICVTASRNFVWCTLPEGEVQRLIVALYRGRETNELKHAVLIAISMCQQPKLSEIELSSMM